MPTKLRRIAVTVDPEMDRALRLAAAHFPGQSAAALVRELALRGAAIVKEGKPPNEKLERLLARPGVRPPRRDLKEFLDRRTERTGPLGEDPYAGTKALEQQRDES